MISPTRKQPRCAVVTPRKTEPAGGLLPMDSYHLLNWALVAEQLRD
ncbi:hypothetical protein HMPREF0578_0467 [Mobiluncus mulieris 28-1]|nr:hypothetical protein HMPREF0578_0467 [Mobiluncus mulieris 28-1]